MTKMKTPHKLNIMKKKKKDFPRLTIRAFMNSPFVSMVAESHGSL